MRQSMCSWSGSAPAAWEELVRNGRIYQYHFRTLEAKRGKILGVICDNSIQDMCHMEFVQAFLEEPGSCYTKKEIEAKKSCSLCCRKNGRVLSYKSETESGDAGRFSDGTGLWEYQTIAREAKKLVGNGCLQKIPEKFCAGITKCC